jgi:hypothetical protein
MTISEAAAQYGVCMSGCGIPAGDHWKGIIDPFGVAHYSSRRFTRRALRNLLLLVARRNRLADPGYLNIRGYDWYYLWLDNVEASRMAMDVGVRLPAKLSRLDRLRCQQLAARQGVRLSRRSSLYAWAHDEV